MCANEWGDTNSLGHHKDKEGKGLTVLDYSQRPKLLCDALIIIIYDNH